MAYAEDAVSYLYWNEYNGAATTDASKCISQIGAANITTAELKLVWNETYTGGMPSETWNSVFGCTHRRQLEPDLRLLGAERLGHRVDVGDRDRARASRARRPTGRRSRSSSRTRRPRSWGTTSTIPIGDVMFFFSYGNYNRLCTRTRRELSTDTSCAGTSTTDDGATRSSWARR